MQRAIVMLYVQTIDARNQFVLHSVSQLIPRLLETEHTSAGCGEAKEE